ncbi:hypothetical protein CRU87_06955 [Aliarcobacter trophiarum LMG 25534]|uniref:Uncharacterized protein n=1 Tax=Aliarcobacter trophiarum LMG 25534 TaxID=1032241 RepID=A0AAD0QKF0_9BACT|nr:hypothetical protein [Aliarcobacter trophiarum]AXK49071.1 hypothetical protein ATR_1212 [Aliarcobacter trophiarum LMG 25534]RXI28235.1 hypothetical protein CRU89_02150 [Aliarcobacter trophiarum]RXJ90960.1 hypothetical protein CRU87_06955 [Aliarcobacter trophiarum LMG 25534]
MLKLYALLSIFVLNLYSSSISFKEEKFVSSLQTSVYKDGLIEFNSDFIKVSYKNLSNSYLFYSDYLLIKDKENEQKFSYEEKVELSLFSKLLNLIYKNKSEDIKEYFKVEKNEKETILLPNEYLANSIEKIEYKKIGDRLAFLKIYFKNEDYIKIVQN